MTGSATIGIVDDDGSIRAGLSSLMRSVGYRVRLFESGEHFMAAYQTSTLACVLTDIQMPGMSGLDLQAALHERDPELPVIIMTAFPEEAMRQQALAAGARDFISKPFDAEIILRSLSLAVARL